MGIAGSDSNGKHRYAGRGLAAGAVLALTVVNLLSLRHAKRVQNLGTAVKFVGLATLAVFLFRRRQPALLAPNWGFMRLGKRWSLGLR